MDGKLMYLSFRIGKVSLAMATRDEYAIQVTKEKLYCAKGFRLQIGNYRWHNGLFIYKGPFEGWIHKYGCKKST